MDPFDPKMTLKKKEEEKGEGEGGRGWIREERRRRRWGSDTQASPARCSVKT